MNTKIEKIKITKYATEYTVPSGETETQCFFFPDFLTLEPGDVVECRVPVEAGHYVVSSEDVVSIERTALSAYRHIYGVHK